MVHILSKDKVDITTLSMLYSLLSSQDNILYIVTDSLYQVPHWNDITDRAQYWFSEVHIIVGYSWYFTMQGLDVFDSVNVRIAGNTDGIFKSGETDKEIKTNRLKHAKTTLITDRAKDKFYKNFANVTEITNEYPFSKDSMLIDDDLQVYPTIESRIGDL